MLLRIVKSRLEQRSNRGDYGCVYQVELAVSTSGQDYRWEVTVDKIIHANNKYH